MSRLPPLGGRPYRVAKAEAIARIRAIFNPDQIAASVGAGLADAFRAGRGIGIRRRGLPLLHLPAR